MTQQRGLQPRGQFFTGEFQLTVPRALDDCMARLDSASSAQDARMTFNRLINGSIAMRMRFPRGRASWGAGGALVPVGDNETRVVANVEDESRNFWVGAFALLMIVTLINALGGVGGSFAVPFAIVLLVLLMLVWIVRRYQIYSDTLDFFVDALSG